MNTKQTNFKIDGIGTVTGGVYDQIKIDGVGKVSGDISFHMMKIDGTCKSTGNLKGDYLRVDGLMKTSGNVKVKEFYIDGLVKSEASKIYADKIRVDGMLKNSGEVNADFIKIDGCVTLNDLFGDEISINYANGINFFHSFIPFKFAKLNTANNIECSKLTACNITCHSISANDIHLSNHCVVDRISCSGTLIYDSTCVIHHIDGGCEKIIK